MAVSGSQKTRIGIGPPVGIKITITAKAASGATAGPFPHYIRRIHHGGMIGMGR